jgi:hypothetical protein
MIHKFRDMPANLNTRKNIFVLIDEAHRTTGGDLGNFLMAGLTVDTFCDLKPVANIAEAIKTAEQSLAAANAADAVKNEKVFQPISLPNFNKHDLETLLLRDLSDLDSKAAAQVQTHFAALGDGGEEWVGDGMHRISPSKTDDEKCPFCVQSLKNSPVISHYRAYFSDCWSTNSCTEDTRSRLCSAQRWRSIGPPLRRHRATSLRLC